MKTSIMLKGLALTGLLIASSHAAAVSCEYIQAGQSFCEVDASGYSNPQPYDFHWYIDGYGPYSGYSSGTWSWQSVYCHPQQIGKSVAVTVYDANGQLVVESSTQARCGLPDLR